MNNNIQECKINYKKCKIIIGGVERPHPEMLKSTSIVYYRKNSKIVDIWDIDELLRRYIIKFPMYMFKSYYIGKMKTLLGFRDFVEHNNNDRFYRTPILFRNGDGIQMPTIENKNSFKKFCVEATREKGYVQLDLVCDDISHIYNLINNLFLIMNRQYNTNIK